LLFLEALEYPYGATPIPVQPDITAF